MRPEEQFDDEASGLFVLSQDGRVVGAPGAALASLGTDFACELLHHRTVDAGPAAVVARGRREAARCEIFAEPAVRVRAAFDLAQPVHHLGPG